MFGKGLAAGVFALLLAGCNRSPVWYPAPAQQTGLLDPSTAPLGSMAVMSDPDAGRYIVSGFRDQSEGPWRWAHEHPKLRFYVPRSGSLKFSMDFTLPETNFQQTGPVNIEIELNGREFDRVHCDHLGDYHYTREVPEDLLRRDAVNFAAIDPDKVATRAGGGEKLGFVLLRAGFTE